MATEFKALIVEEPEKNSFTRHIGTKSTDDLPDGEVLIRVEYSSLNYKDALSATGNRGVTRKFPHTPGIDAAGTVAESSVDTFAAGDAVIVTGFDLGMNTAGGYGEYVRVPAKWVLPLPTGLTGREAMTLGTAGLTAGLSVDQLIESGVTPDKGEILVTGATGGVGSVAVSILAKLGYTVVAVTGKESETEFLKGLGAAEVILREAFMEGSERPMLKERWAGAVDVAGGAMLAAVLKSTKYGGVVTCCGLVGDIDLPVNVFPFILRGVRLIGIDSVESPIEWRSSVWQHLANDWKISLAELTTEITLNDLEDRIQAILAGGQKGRVLVNMQG